MKLTIFRLPSDHRESEDTTENPRVVASALLSEGVRGSTASFLRAVHPGDKGFLELRAFQKGKSPAPPKFIPLPLDDLAAVRDYGRTHGDHYNIYHAIATRKTNTSGRLENCSELWALYIEIDFKNGVPLLEIWTALKNFALPPSFVVHSGGGLHVYWCLAEPINLTTDLSLAYQWLGDLAHRLYGEPESTEPARVLRVPDTLNLKTEYGPSAPNVTIIRDNGGWEESRLKPEDLAVRDGQFIRKDGMPFEPRRYRP